MGPGRWIEVPVGCEGAIRGRGATEANGGAGCRFTADLRGPRNALKPSLGVALLVIHSYNTMRATMGECVALRRMIRAWRNL